MGAAIEKNFFDFYFSDFSPYSQNVWIENIFLFSRFSHSISTRILFFYFFKTLLQLVKFSLGIPYQLLSFLVLYSFDYDLEFTSYR